MNDTQELCAEAQEIITNARQAWKNGEITRDQYEEVRRNTLLDVGYQLEIITEKP
jgi:hypothetical protein